MNDNLPVRWDEILAKDAKAAAALERPSLSMISLKAGVMKYQDQIVPGNKLEVIIIASVFENQWFENKYDPNVRENPQCFALSLEGKDMRPDPISPKIQSDSCADCPQFQWGSAEGNSRGKACKQKRRLALLPATFLKSTDVTLATLEMALMTIPVTSGKNWANYVNAVSAEYQRPPWAVLTEVSVVPDARTQFQVKFKTLATVSNEYLGDLQKRREQAEATLMTPYDYSAGEAEKPVEKASKAGKKY